MAVIVTNGTGTKLSDTNAFYRVETYNASYASNTTANGAAINTARYIPLTFANAGNFKGTILAFLSNGGGVDRDIGVRLQKGNTITVTIASPGVVTLASHGFATGTSVWFTTTGALPTGITAGTNYYTRSTECADPTNQFRLYTSEAAALTGGSTGRVNTSGTQSGVHTCWNSVATQTLSYSAINAGYITGYNTYGMYWVNFNNFNNTIAVDTTANKRRLRVFQSGGTTGTIYMVWGYDAATFHHWTYCDTLMTHADGDTFWIAHPTEIDKTFSSNSVLGTGDTVWGVCGGVCSNMSDISVDNVSLLTCLNPSAPYTWTMNGVFLVNTNGGIRVGTEDSPIPTANKFTIILGTANVGTTNGGIRSHMNNSSATYHYATKQNFFMYGACDITKMRGEIAETAPVYQTYVLTTEDMSTYGWEVGDYIGIGKQNVLGQGDNSTFKILAFNRRCVTPYMTSNNTPIPYVVSASGYVSAYNPYEAFDRTRTSSGSWRVTSTTTSWLKIDLGAGNEKTITNYAMWNAAGTVDKTYAPKNWTYEGSNNDTDWDVLDTQTNVTNRDNTNYFSFSNSTAYRYYRVNITANNGGATYTQITEMCMLETLPAGTYSIALDGWISTNDRLEGGTIINLTEDKCGCSIKANTGTRICYFNVINNFNVEGTYIKDAYAASGNVYYYADAPDIALQRMTVKNCIAEYTSTSAYFFATALRVGRLGMTIDNNVGFRGLPACIMSNYKSSVYSSGDLVMTNQYILNKYSYYLGNNGKALFTSSNIYIENSNTYYDYVINLAPGSTVDGVYLWGGNNGGSTGYGNLAIGGQCMGASIKNVWIDKAFIGFKVDAIGIALNNTFDNINIGTEAANTADYLFDAGSLFDSVIKNSTGFDINRLSDFSNSTEGTKVRFVDYDDTATKDFMWTTYGNLVRCGTGLTDTTTVFAGDSYCFRQEAIGGALEWAYDSYAGNKQGKVQVLSVYAKINSANYYAGTYNKPKLMVEYDGGASYVEIEMENNTNIQRLQVSYVPATTNGVVTVKLVSETDAVGGDAYVYFGHFEGNIPSVGAMNIWYQAEPVLDMGLAETNATALASSVWAYPTASILTTGSIGEMIKNVFAFILKLLT